MPRTTSWGEHTKRPGEAGSAATRARSAALVARSAERGKEMRLIRAAKRRRQHMFGDAVRDLLDPRLRGGGGRLGALGAGAGGAGSE